MNLQDQQATEAIATGNAKIGPGHSWPHCRDWQVADSQPVGRMWKGNYTARRTFPRRKIVLTWERSAKERHRGELPGRFKNNLGSPDGSREQEKAQMGCSPSVLKVESEVPLNPHRWP